MIATSSLWTCQSQPGNYVRKGAVYQGTGLIQGGGVIHVSELKTVEKTKWWNQNVSVLARWPTRGKAFRNVMCTTAVFYRLLWKRRCPRSEVLRMILGTFSLVLDPVRMQSFGVESCWETLDAAQLPIFFDTGGMSCIPCQRSCLFKAGKIITKKARYWNVFLKSVPGVPSKKNSVRKSVWIMLKTKTLMRTGVGDPWWPCEMMVISITPWAEFCWIKKMELWGTKRWRTGQNSIKNLDCFHLFLPPRHGVLNNSTCKKFSQPGCSYHPARGYCTYYQRTPGHHSLTAPLEQEFGTFCHSLAGLAGALGWSHQGSIERLELLVWTPSRCFGWLEHVRCQTNQHDPRGNTRSHGNPGEWQDEILI